MEEDAPTLLQSCQTREKGKLRGLVL